jgi:broad specificity phosphatase PhoE
MKIFFARHGESQANLLREYSCVGLKHPLTGRGRLQASALAQALQDRAIHHIYASPVLRALETSVIVAYRLGVEYTVVEALREFSVGVLEGQIADPAWQPLRDLFQDWSLHRRLERRIEGGESFYDVQQRFVPFIAGLTGEYGRTDENLLCVAHGGLYRAMLPEVLTNVDQNFIDSNGGIDYTDCIVAELRPEGLVCVEWNGVALG